MSTLRQFEEYATPELPSAKLAKRYQTALSHHRRALEWLRGIGVDQTLADALGIGLETGSANSRARDAIIVPRRDATGLFADDWIRMAIPGVTQFTDERRATTKPWARNADQSRFYFSDDAGGKKVILIVPTLSMVWSTMGACKGDGAGVPPPLVVCPVTGWPDLPRCIARYDAPWWKNFDQVILVSAQAESDRALVAGCAAALGRFGVALRVFAVPATDDVIVNEARPISKLLALAQPAAAPASTEPAPLDVQRNFREVDVTFTFHAGKLYWAFEAPVVQLDRETGQPTEHFATRVLRSDGEILTIRLGRRAPLGGRSITRLSDGTAIDPVPRPLKFSKTTWEYESILRFAHCMRRGEKPSTPTLGEMLRRIVQHLKATVWIQDEEMYAVLALGVVVSYGQVLFDAVPLFLGHGPKGSGKSTLTIEVAALGCNGVMLSRTTLAALMETANRHRGLVAVDDLEEMAPSKANKADATPLQQVIKTSYQKDSATHSRLNEDGDVAERSTYGVKVINSTGGMDEITATRAFTVRMRKRTAEVAAKMRELAGSVLSEQAKAELRNNLHTWIFANVPLTRSTFEQIQKETVERSDQISAPLRTFAKIAGDAQLSADLELAIMKRSRSGGDAEAAAYIEALDNCICRGQSTVTAYQVINEMSQILGKDWDRSHSGEIPSWRQPRAVTAKLHLEGWVQPQEAARPRVNHGGSIVRRLTAYAWDHDFLASRLKALAESNRQIDATQQFEFCSGCAGCEYAANCVLRGPDIEWRKCA